MTDEPGGRSPDGHPPDLNRAIRHYADRLGQVNMLPLIAMRQFLTVSHMVMLDLARVTDRLGYSFADLHLLGSLGIDRSRPVRATDLASILYVSNATLSGRIVRLEKHGLLVRQRSEPDHRSFDLFLTEKGEALVDRCIHELASSAKITRLFSDMDPDTLSDFKNVLLQIHNVLERDMVVRHR